MIQYVCDVCGDIKEKKDCFIFDNTEKNVLCLKCFKELVNDEVEIYVRRIIQEFSQQRYHSVGSGRMEFEDYFVLLDTKNQKVPDGYKPFKKLPLKNVDFAEPMMAMTILNGCLYFPCPGNYRSHVLNNPIV